MRTTILLLVCSNVFMTLAWYGHLRFPHAPLRTVIAVSWGIALLEYCFQVPANRHGHGVGLSGAELKTIQEVITLVVFVVFAKVYLGEALRWNVLVGFACMALGALLVFAPWRPPAAPAETPASVLPVP